MSLATTHRPLKRVLSYARRELGMSQHELGSALAVSARTVMRWQKGHTSPADFQVRQIAAMLHDSVPDLAEELLAAANVVPETTPREAMPAPAPNANGTAPVAAPSDGVPAHVIDAIVCVAADAAGMVPRAIRPALLAAFERARELGVSVEAAAAGLLAYPSAPSR